MMSLVEAVAYGKSVGCRWYVYADVDGRKVLCAGVRERSDADDMRERFERDYAKNPFTRDCHVRVYVEEC